MPTAAPPRTTPPDPGTREVWLVAALYFAGTSMLALAPEITMTAGVALAAGLAAIALVFALAGLADDLVVSDTAPPP